MKRVPTVLLVAMVAPACALEAQGWDTVPRSRGAVDVTAFDTLSFSKSGSTVRVTTARIYDSIQSGPAFRYKSDRARMEFDCQRNTFRILAGQSYDSIGRMVYQFPPEIADLDPAPITKGTVLAEEAFLACTMAGLYAMNRQGDDGDKRWRNVRISPREAMAIDTLGLTRKGKTVAFWLRTLETTFRADSMPYESTAKKLARFEIDCLEHTIQLRSVVQYRADGSVERHRDFSEVPTSIAPETSGEEFATLLCPRSARTLGAPKPPRKRL